MSDIVVTLPDGSEISVPEGSTVETIAYEIGPGLGDDAVAGVVDGELVDLASPVADGAEVEIVTADSDEYLRVMRHSAAHVFAQALQRCHPDAKLAIGPPTDEGFYYDVFDVDLDADDLDEIEAEMEAILDEDLAIEREERDREAAFDTYEDNPYKRDVLETEAAGEDPVSFYVQGKFEDLCQGPHVDSTGDIGAVKLLSIASAYWRGDEANDQLTRVYGTAFESEADLEAFVERREQAEKRDHRRIGREMDLFSIPDHSPGCVHYHPAGMRVRRELEAYIRDRNEELGYDEVWTPELNRKELWEESGHLDFFGDEGEFFLWEQDDEAYGLKPMNCANHAYIYGSETRSYRDLPVRLSEFGTVYRNERSGELSGLLRVRGMTQDDGHAFIREDQIEAEIERTLDVTKRIYDEFGLDVSLVLETKPDNAQGPDELWATAESTLRDVLEANAADYHVEEGEGSFYGPKIGIEAEDAIGRTWQVGTVQLDFIIPRHLDLTYVGADNEEHHPVMVHRALLGSIERFMGVMVEHFAGDFPLWLAPEQVRVLPVSDENLDYAETVVERLDDAGIRATVERHDWTVGRKIRAGHDDRVPYMLIVGDREESEGTVSVRDREERERDGVPLNEFRDHVVEERDDRRLDPDFLAGVETAPEAE